ncbi:Flp family type IVb pilin [Comamonas testosteroni]|uniref:Flp family type IVb pilin n=1 Tax=Comamonas testosteroni TaxID=285 RepID=UPI00265FBE9A|nr:Flp family type IVb pilin [Comamonas testosteroni]WKL13570.1 Flp family type IVb pilin [Comamonas testosteroni]
MKDQIIKFWRDEEGATAIEYGLIAGLIAVGLIVSLEGVRNAIGNLFTRITDVLGTVAVTNGGAGSGGN